MNILIVAAHPDDEVLGCGATLARLSRDHNVYVAILGEGITSRHARREDAEASALRKLKAQAREAAKRLGARDVFLESLPDNRFDTVPLLDIVKHVERWVGELRPEVIYTHHRGDLNIDHVLTYRAVLTATRPAAGMPVREIYTFEVGSSTEWAFASASDAFHPTVFVPVEDTLELKIEALNVYDTETRPFPHPRSPEALRARARHWGSTVGVAAAEAFELVRAVRG